MTSRLHSLFGDTDIRPVMAAIVSISAVGMGLGLSSPLLSLLMENDGMSSALIGANTAVAGLAAILAVPFVTSLALRIGVANALMLNIALGALCLFLFYWTTPVPDWFILRFAFSIALSMAFVLSEFWINSSASDENRGFILGIYGTVLSLGFAGGPAIVAFTGTEGITPFLVGAVIILAAALPVLAAKDYQPVMEKGENVSSIWPYVTIVPLATAAGFVFGAVEQAELALLPVFGVKAGFSQTEAATLLVSLGLGHVACQIPLGIWSDRVKDRRSILLFCVMTGIVASITVPQLINNPMALHAALFIFGGIIGGMYTIGLAHLGSRLKGTDLAQANAAFVMCYAIGMLVGPQLVGLSMDLYGTNGFGIGLGFFFVLYLILHIARRNINPPNAN